MISSNLRYDAARGLLVNINTGQTSPAPEVTPINGIATLNNPALLNLELVSECLQRWRDEATGVEYLPFVAESIRDYDPPPLPDAPFEPGVTYDADTDTVSVQLYDFAVPNAGWLTLRYRKDSWVADRFEVWGDKLIGGLTLQRVIGSDPAHIQLGAGNEVGTTWGELVAAAA